MLLSHLPRSLLLLTLALADLLPPTTASAHLRPGQPTELNSPLRRQDDNNDNDPYEAKLPDDLPQRMGMIYPDPSESLYPGRIITLGFLDLSPQGSTNYTIPGIFRLVTLTLTYSNRTTITLDPPFGTLSMTPPPSSYYPPRPRQGWCLITLYPTETHTREFEVPKGLMVGEQVRFTVNVTYGLPSYNGDDKTTNCTNPAQLYKTFFLSHLLPISPSPPSPSPPPLFPSPPSPPTATTTYVTLSTLLPPTVPIPIDHSQDSARRGFAAMGAVLGIGILAAFGVWFWAARRRARGLVPGLGDGIGGVRYEGEGDMRERERMGGRY